MKKLFKKSLLIVLLILADQSGATLSVTYSFSPNTLIISAQFNQNFTDIETVVNALTADNYSADSVTAAKLNGDVVRADYGLIQHTDGSLYVDVSDTNPGLELADGGLRVLCDGSTLQRGASGLEVIQSGLDHGSVGGLADDDHSQYYNAARHTAAVHNSLGITPGDLTVAEGKVAASAVSQSKLKTSQGEVSLNSGNTPGLNVSVNTLPGGEYGFYPRLKATNSINGQAAMAAIIGGLFTDTTAAAGTADTIDSYAHGTSYITNITLMSSAIGGTAGNQTTAYAQQRYVTASGKDHWIFLLVEKDTKKIVRGWQAPDHPCYGTDLTEEELSHPFNNFDETKYEVILIDNGILEEIKTQITSKKSLLTLINEDYEVDETANPQFSEREIIEIDENDEKPGEVIAEIATPDWAKIKISKDKFKLKRRLLTNLPAEIKFKKLKKKGA